VAAWRRGLNVNLGWSPQPVLMLRAKCAGEWPTDFRMRVVCVTRQQTALQTLHQRSPQIDADAVLRDLRARCLAEWSTPAPPGPEGRAAKAERWFTDYRMMNHCEEQQLNALSGLQGG
jgi:hypothetical protein